MNLFDIRVTENNSTLSDAELVLLTEEAILGAIEAANAIWFDEFMNGKVGALVPTGLFGGKAV